MNSEILELVIKAFEKTLIELGYKEEQRGRIRAMYLSFLDDLITQEKNKIKDYE